MLCVFKRMSSLQNTDRTFDKAFSAGRIVFEACRREGPSNTFGGPPYRDFLESIREGGVDVIEGIKNAWLNKIELAMFIVACLDQRGTHAFFAVEDYVFLIFEGQYLQVYLDCENELVPILDANIGAAELFNVRRNIWSPIQSFEKTQTGYNVTLRSGTNAFAVRLPTPN